MLKNDIVILRKTAVEYLNALYKIDNFKARNLQRNVNDKTMIRPVVLIDEIPWHEMNFNGELDLFCEDNELRTLELYMKKIIFQAKYFPADMIMLPYIPVNKVVKHTGIGVSVEEKILLQNKGNNIKSHEYVDQLQTMEDLEKLHCETVTYDEVATMKKYELYSNILGDILPVRVVGIQYVSISTWDVISELRGVTPLLIDLMDEPELMHATTKKLTDIFWDKIKQYEKLELFDYDPHKIHCTSAASKDLQLPEDGSPRKIKDVWGRGVAQIFASVGKDMHEEFDIEYMKNTVGKCGLVYYGCCEPLDKKIDIVEKIPNLRKISITPWADVNVAAEAINKKYVIASKPNPAALAVDNLDETALKKEIDEILSAAKRNNCNIELTLKDISTCCQNPNNLFKWHDIVMDMVKNY